MNEPSQESQAKIAKYVEKYREKTGTSAHPDPEITRNVSLGLASNMDEVGRPLCPCVFYPDKKKELEENGRRWICACDEMKQYKFCHCLLFVRPDGLPITEYLPEDHYAVAAYGRITDPTPDKGRESK